VKCDVARRWSQISAYKQEIPVVQRTTIRLGTFALLLVPIVCGEYPQRYAYAQSPAAQDGAAAAEQKTSTRKLTKAQKIALAVSAGPLQITKNATISDMLGMPGEQHEKLREGTNGWVCYASIPQPMCLDKQWQEWAEAWMTKREPKIDGPGVAYMLRGDNGASNTDPWAKAPTV
jgi:hypothetical protein